MVTGFLTGLGVTAAAAVGLTVGAGAALAIGSSILAVSLYAVKRASDLYDVAEVSGSRPRSQTRELVVRSTEAPRTIAYGQVTVGGVLTFINTAGDENRDLYMEIALTGHEIDSFIGFYIGDRYVPLADIDTGGDGSVYADTNSHGYSPPTDTGITILWLRGHLGTAAQTVDSQLDAAFSEITSTHRHRGCARLNVKMHLLNGFENVWDGGVSPDSIRSVIRGAKVYDPRLDSTFTGPEYGAGSGTHRPSDPTTWEWSDNPALVWADYRRQSLGPAWAASRIDYDSVAIAADECDASVDIPTAATEARFTCNMSCSTADEPSTVINTILGSMFGEERDFNGAWHVYAGVYEAPAFTLTEDDFIGSTPYRVEPQFTDRFNLVRGGYYDPERLDKFVPFIEVADANLQTNRDAGEELPKELRLEATSSEYMAQRIGFRHLSQAALPGVLIVRVGYKAANLRVGDRVSVTHPSLSFDAKVFRVIKIQFVPLVGFELTLKEDAESAYDDPDEGDYGQRTAAGIISFPRPVIARVPAGLVRDPAFSDAYGVSWFTRGGFNGSIVAGETGNALRLGTSANTSAKWYVGNRAQFEAANREWFTLQSRIRRDGDFGAGSSARIGVTALDSDGSEVAEAEVVIDDGNFATYMPSPNVWYDFIITVQVIQSYTTTRQFGLVTVSKSNGGTAFNSPTLDFDFIQVIRGQAA